MLGRKRMRAHVPWINHVIVAGVLGEERLTRQKLEAQDTKREDVHLRVSGELSFRLCGSAARELGGSEPRGPLEIRIASVNFTLVRLRGVEINEFPCVIDVHDVAWLYVRVNDSAIVKHRHRCNDGSNDLNTRGYVDSSNSRELQTRVQIVLREWHHNRATVEFII
tara:strand:- start:137 stop:634 length:498 start_codon:yes stop_codon:yes gene_type:complete